MAAIVEEDFTDRAPNLLRPRRSFHDAVNGLTEAEFKRCFRISRNSFHKRFLRIRHALEAQKDMAIRSSSGPVEPEVRLAVVVRMKAGAQHVDLRMLFGISKFSAAAPEVPGLGWNWVTKNNPSEGWQRYSSGFARINPNTGIAVGQSRWTVGTWTKKAHIRGCQPKGGFGRE